MDPKVDRMNSSSSTSYSHVSRVNLVMLLNDFNLCDIWRFLNPQTKQYSWRKPDCSIQSRLDYWFIPYDSQDNVSNIICTFCCNWSFRVDIGFEIYWLNSRERIHEISLLQDDNYCTSLRKELQLWLKQTNNIADPRVRWDYLKYQILRYTQKYSKHKARELKAERIKLEKKVHMNSEQIRNYQEAKRALEKYYDHVMEGLIIRSKANWIEYGGKSNKYFLTLEKQRKGNSTIRKLSKETDIIKDEQEILQSIKNFNR